MFNSEYGEYYLVGEGEPPQEGDLYEGLSKEELGALREQEERWYEDMKQRKKEEEKKEKEENGGNKRNNEKASQSNPMV